MALVRGVLWLALFIILTFCFIVLLEHGPRDFTNGARKEYARIKSFVVERAEQAAKPKKQR